MYLGEYEISSTVTFNFQAYDGGGQPIDAAGTPTFEVFVNNAAMDPPVTGTLEKMTRAEANGFEAGNTYTIRIAAVIDGVPTLTTDTFRTIANSQTTVSASYTQTTAEENTVPVDADNPFDAALMNASKHFKSAFGKEIVILPDGVTERTVVARIRYLNVEPVPGLTHGKSRSITLTVDNNEITGLSTEEFDRGKAVARVPEDVGKDPVEKRISKILRQNAARVTYQV